MGYLAFDEYVGDKATSRKEFSAELRVGLRYDRAMWRANAKIKLRDRIAEL